MPLALLAVLLPALYWDRPVESADQLRKAGIERLDVPPGQEPAWRKQGFEATGFDRAHAVQAVAPRVEYRMDVASATRIPWIDANGWRYARDPGKPFFYNAPMGSAALTAAEAFAYGGDAAIRAELDDLALFSKMLKFLGALDQSRLPSMANIGIVDDRSDGVAEVMNLLGRHNLLFHIVVQSNPKYDLNIKQVPRTANPYEFAMQVRRDLGDDKRLLRIYGSNVVIGRLSGDESRIRVDLLNYGKGAVKGLRVRVLGVYAQGKLAAFERPDAALADYRAEDGATEFTVPELGTYAVVDLHR